MKVPRILRRKLDKSIPIGVPYPHIRQHNVDVAYLQKTMKISARTVAMGGQELEHNKKVNKETAKYKMADALFDYGYVAVEEQIDPVTQDLIQHFWVPVMKASDTIPNKISYDTLEGLY